MAVEVKYVVIREGEEKMSFTSKKEADAFRAVVGFCLRISFRCQ